MPPACHVSRIEILPKSKGDGHEIPGQELADRDEPGGHAGQRGIQSRTRGRARPGRARS